MVYTSQGTIEHPQAERNLYLMLRRDSPDPLYVQIKEFLISEIKAGHYRPDQRLPSERELSEQFQVGRMTVRQALLALMHEGKTYTRIGKGTFVLAPKIDQQLRALTGFSQDVQSRGGQPSSQVLDARIIQAPPNIANKLNLQPGTDTILLSRLRLADGTPMALETAHLPHTLFPNLLAHDFAVESLYEVLQHEYNVSLVQAEQTIEAGLASPHEIEMLSLKPPAAVLKMERLSYNQDRQPVEYVFSIYRADRYKFHSTLHVETHLS